MRCHWEKFGVLGPICEQVGQGLSDRAIANQLNLNEVTVHSSVSWLSHFLKCSDREALVLYVLPATEETWILHAAA